MPKYLWIDLLKCLKTNNSYAFNHLETDDVIYEIDVKILVLKQGLLSPGFSNVFRQIHLNY